jgi:hypothetical protein
MGGWIYSVVVQLNHVTEMSSVNVVKGKSPVLLNLKW